MDKEQKEILKQANIPITWWEYCTIKDGVIYTPNMEVLHENNLVSEEEYQYWLSQQEQIDICPKPTAEERITQLEADKEALAQNVYMLAEVLEALLGGEEDGQEEPITEDTAG